MSLDITIKTVPHNLQRYDTVGDWRVTDTGWEITVSDLGDWRMAIAVAVHELVECALCCHDMITQREVDDFDLHWQWDDEPGNSTSAPYYRQHVFASMIERMVAAELDIDWNQYEERCQKLGSTWSPNKATELASPSG